jgi:hypothetical protein
MTKVITVKTINQMLIIRSGSSKKTKKLRGNRSLSKKEQSIVISMSEDRLERIEKMLKMIEESGKGLMKSQIEIKHVPWQVTWERQDMMLERQEKIIELLEKILEEIKKD